LVLGSIRGQWAGKVPCRQLELVGLNGFSFPNPLFVSPRNPCVPELNKLLFQTQKLTILQSTAKALSNGLSIRFLSDKER
jgi:hypothetical protein